MRTIKQLLCLLVLVLMISLSFAEGEGGWVKVGDSVGMTMESPMIYFDHKLVTPRWPDCIQILPVTDTGEVGEWNGFSPQGLTVYRRLSIATTDKYMFLSGGYYETMMYQSGYVPALYQLTLSPDSIGYVAYSGSMDTPRGKHSSLMVNDYLYMFGGTGNSLGFNQLSTVSYAKFNRTTERLEEFQSGYPFKQIQGPVYSSFRLGNKVYCFGPRIIDGWVDLLERPYYIESADIQEDGKLGPWNITGGPYKGIYPPVSAIFTQQSTLFVFVNRKSSSETINPCYAMDLKDGGVEGNKFKSVTGFTPSILGGSDLGLGTWGRFICVTDNYNYIYDPLLTSAPLFEEPNSDRSLYD